MTHLKGALIRLLRGLTLGFIAFMPVDAAEEERRPEGRSSTQVWVVADVAREEAEAGAGDPAGGEALAADDVLSEAAQSLALRRYLASVRLRGYRYRH